MNDIRYQTLLKMGYDEDEADKLSKRTSMTFIEAVVVCYMLLRNVYRRFLRGFERIMGEWIDG